MLLPIFKFLFFALQLLSNGICVHIEKHDVKANGEGFKSKFTSKHSTKNKKHFTAPVNSVKYGTDLPAFAFDYSEYFSGAVIERSDPVNDLHLVMFTLGHRSVRSSSTFSALSTDETVLSSWGQLVKKWGSGKRMVNANVNSGLACVIHNNDQHNHPYQVSAHWVMEPSTADSSETTFNGKFGILRCKIRGTGTVFRNSTYLSNRKLFVDVVRKSASDIPEHSNNVTSSPSGGMTSDPRSVVISFSVPWNTRQCGYPLRFKNSSRFDPWAGVRHRDQSSVDVDAPTNASQPFSPAGTVICASGLRPLNPFRAEVGLPMLLEFVEHHLLLGVDHIFLGIAIDWGSKFMTKHLRVLRAYIEEGKVSVVSMSASGASVDDGAVLAGVLLQDHFADVFFLNQCLYFAKGYAAHVVILRASQFLLPTAAGATVSSLLRDTENLELPNHARRMNDVALGDEHHALTDSKQRLRGSRPAGSSGRSGSLVDLFTNSRHKAKYDPDAASSAASSLATLSSQSDRARWCSLSISGYGVPDPPDAFASWGPGDSAWTADYFKTSKPVKIRCGGAYDAVVLLTSEVAGVDVHPSGQIRAFCSTDRTKFGKSHLRNKLPQGDFMPSQNLTSGFLPVSRVAVWSFQSEFPATQIDVSVGSNLLLETYNERMENMGAAVRDKLSSRGIGSLVNLSLLVEHAKSEHTANVEQGADETIRSRNSLVAPFWISLNATFLLKQAVEGAYG